ncbi:MAG: cation:proton antiporter [Sutterellaceae bacterium]|nr:cation:proton antiporter [Sutterellaceae bacterium]MDY2867934.1 cation:proton antiporter [Mesosutterella sp.]
MDHSLPLISTLVVAFSLALVFGYIAERFLKTPPLVGYLLAGIAVGQHTPGVYADQTLASQLSEIGVMLLMFGVGLHFSFKNLLKVKGIAVPGAVLQMVCATLLGGAITHFFWGWHWGEALVLGLCLSCASTVVLIKALEVQGIQNTMDGQIAVGWLVVEDIATVVILVLLPVFAKIVKDSSASVSVPDVLWAVLVTLFNVAAFVAIMLLVGRRLLPWGLKQISRTGSRELFTLFVLAVALGVAFGAAEIFHVSFALGAFFAGTVMQESSYAHRAASETLPFQDAFSVLFFVGVGMMLDWHILLQSPIQVLVVLLIIMLGKSAVAFTLVHLLQYPLHTSLTVSASLAQIGEFSFILVVEAMGLGLADRNTVNLIVGAALFSIALNPVVFGLIPQVKEKMKERWAWAKAADERKPAFSVLEEDEAEEAAAKSSMLVVGDSPFALLLMKSLHEAGIPIVAVVRHHEEAKKLSEVGCKAVVGDPQKAETFRSARAERASRMVLFNTSTEAPRMVRAARRVNQGLAVTVVGWEPGVWAELPQFEGVRFIDGSKAAMENAISLIRGSLEKGTDAGDPVGLPPEKA